jgi:hypothetical protein
LKSSLPDAATALLGRWLEHFGGMDHADIICRYATFEIGLQQAFAKRLRSEADVEGLADQITQ